MTTEIIRKYIDILAESGLSRVYAHTLKHDYGVITGERDRRDCGKGDLYTAKENQARNNSLMFKLRAKGYAVTGARGSFIENYGSDQAKEVAENVFIVVDIKDHGNLEADLVSLGEEFDQDCILFGKAGADSELIGTNHCPNGYPGYHVRAAQGGALFGKTGQFMTRVSGRPFIFSEGVEAVTYPVARFPTEYRGMVLAAGKHWTELLEYKG